MPTDDLIQLVENEIRWRLSNDACETCGRGAEAHEMADTAIAKLANDLARLKLAQQSREVEEQQEGTVNPLALVASVSKLPIDHPKRGELLELLDGQIISLQAAREQLGSVETVSS